MINATLGLYFQCSYQLQTSTSFVRIPYLRFNQEKVVLLSFVEPEIILLSFDFFRGRVTQV